MWQRDSAPAHTARTAVNYLRREMPAFWDPTLWPPSSLDLNPCDYYLWDALKRVACAKPHSSVPSFCRSIAGVMRNLDPAEVRSACAKFRPRLEAVLASEGAHVE